MFTVLAVVCGLWGGPAFVVRAVEALAEPMSVREAQAWQTSARFGGIVYLYSLTSHHTMPCQPTVMRSACECHLITRDVAISLHCLAARPLSTLQSPPQ